MSNPNDPNASPAGPPPQPEQPSSPQYAPPAAPQYSAPQPQYAAPQQPLAPQYQTQPPVRATNTLAIIALITSFFLSVVGVILGHISLSQIKRTGEGGRGLAIAALVVGYIGIAVWAIVIAVWFFAIIAVASAGVSSNY